MRSGCSETPLVMLGARTDIAPVLAQADMVWPDVWTMDAV